MTLTTKLNKLSKIILSTSSLLLVSQLHAAGHSTSEVELVSVPTPGHHVEQQSVHFSQSVGPDIQLNMAQSQYSTTSDEYWFETTGAKLNQGIDLDVSHPGALIRLSSKKIKGEILPDDHAIDPKHLELSKNGKKFDKPFKQTVTQEQLATANIFPNSSAVKLDKNLGKGQFKLKVAKTLKSDQRYMINVKEKGALHKLHLSTKSQSYLAGQSLSFNAQMGNNDHALTKATHKAFIKMPDGQMKQVKLNKHNDQLNVEVPAMTESAKIGQLFELHLESVANDKGTKVRRNGKFAFAMAQPTARIADSPVIKNSHAMIPLEVASEGRFEVSALVYGTNANNKLVPMMLSRSAHYLRPGQQQVELRFEQSLIEKSGLSAPFALKRLQLKDQSRMALLQ